MGGVRGLLGTVVIVLGLVVAACGGSAHDRRPDTKAKAKAVHDYGALPLSFVPNAGQADPQARYLAQGGGFGFFFTERGVTLTFAHDHSKGMALELGFAGANAHPRITASAPASGTVSYLGAKSHAGLSTYGELTYHDVWPGIDVTFRGAGGRLKYEFHVAPFADPARIALAYRGADHLSRTAAGELRIATELGTLSDERPTSAQGQAQVETAYRLADDRYGFTFPHGYDRSQPLVIDPSLAYSTFLGGPDLDDGSAVAVDAQGNVYVAGSTSSTSFPTTVGAYDTSFDASGGSNRGEAFVSKLNPAGNALVYSTFIGGPGDDWASALAVDTNGSVYVAGSTLGNSFPTTANVVQSVPNGGGDAFVAHLNAAGTALLYSTLLGGNSQDQALDIAIDGQGNAYVAGTTYSSDFPTTFQAYDRTLNGNQDAFVTKLTQLGGTLSYSTYLGGKGYEQQTAIALDAQNDVYIAGPTDSTDYPTTPGAFDRTHEPYGKTDSFVSKLNPSGGALIYSTMLGGIQGFDSVYDVAVDGDGSAYVTGYTNGSDFPVTPGAYDTTMNSTSLYEDAFVTKIAPSGASLVYSTFIGGPGTDYGGRIAVDAQGSAYIAGRGSAGYPVTPGAYNTTTPGLTVTKLAPSGAALLYATFLGGLDPSALAIDPAGFAYVAGSAITIATTPGAYDTTFNGGGSDAFVTKLDASPPDTLLGSGPGGPTNSTSPAFGFSATEAGSSFECRLDTPAGAGVFGSCNSPQGYSTAGNGSYTFSVRAVDAAGNPDITPATRSFTVDTVAPDTSVTGPSGLTSQTTQSFSFDSSEAGSTYECRLDTPTGPGGYGACTSQYSTIVNGAYTLLVRAVDPAGNADPTPATRSFTVDTVAPNTSLSGGATGFTNQTTQSFTLDSTEAGSTYECRLDTPGGPGGYGACSQQYTTTTNGAYTFSVRATDLAGNTDPTPATRSFTVDTVAPDTSVSAGADGPTDLMGQSFAFASSEPGSTYECRLDDPPRASAPTRAAAHPRATSRCSTAPTRSPCAPPTRPGTPTARRTPGASRSRPRSRGPSCRAHLHAERCPRRPAGDRRDDRRGRQVHQPRQRRADRRRAGCGERADRLQRRRLRQPVRQRAGRDLSLSLDAGQLRSRTPAQDRLCPVQRTVHRSLADLPGRHHPRRDAADARHADPPDPREGPRLHAAAEGERQDLGRQERRGPPRQGPDPDRQVQGQAAAQGQPEERQRARRGRRGQPLGVEEGADPAGEAGGPIALNLVRVRVV